MRVVVLTGRTVADVAARVRVGGIDYLGDHGLQSGRLVAGRATVRDPGRRGARLRGQADPAERLATGVAAELGHPPWLFVERKGPSVAFHVRQAEDVAAARATVVAAIERVEARDGSSTTASRTTAAARSWTCDRGRAGGKREAVDRLLTQDAAGAVVVLGDELSDVDAFEAVRAARAADGGLVGLTVAVHGTRPAPAELSAVADLHLASARAVGRFLDSWRGLAAEGVVAPRSCRRRWRTALACRRPR